MNNNNNNSCSIASLVCGIVSLFILPFIFGIAGVILGIIALAKQEQKNGCAILGIIIGIVGVIWAYYANGMI